MYERHVKKKLQLTIKSISERLQFAIEHIDKDQAFGNYLLWADESKIVLFGAN